MNKLQNNKKKVSRPSRKGSKLPEFLEQSEYARYLKAIRRASITGVRNYAMIRLMAEAGLRCEEVTGLKPNAINEEDHTIKVLGKGNRERILAVNGETLAALQKWNEWKERFSLEKSKYYFCNRRAGKVDNRSVRFVVSLYGRKAQLAKRVHPHMLRHTFATQFYRQTKDLAAVQRALGHKHINNTMIYTHIVDEQVQDAMKSFKLKP